MGMVSLVSFVVFVVTLVMGLKQNDNDAAPNVGGGGVAQSDS